MRIKLVSIHVKSPTEAFRFYTEVLGFIERMYVPEANLAIVASPEDPDGTDLLLEPNDNPIAKAYQAGLYGEGLPMIVFGVENLQKEYERLMKMGVVFQKKPTTTDWGIEAIFDDTCGNLIQLHQAKK
jgi:predicted enzyme related to lactoylglutathione lyase